MPAVVHEALQGYQPCIDQPWHVGALGNALPWGLLIKGCHDTLPAALLNQPQRNTILLQQ